MMVLLVAYDVSDNKTRTKLAKLLLNHGRRIQKSVFVIDVRRHRHKKLMRDIGKLVDEEDRVVVARLCAGCQRTTLQVGVLERHLFVL